MIPLPPDAPMSVRLGARIGPEIVATVLVVAVAFVGLVAFLGVRQGPGPGPAASAVPSVAVVPSASPGESPTPPSSVPARAVLEVVDRLLAQRTSLDAAVGDAGTETVVIADLLREINASLVFQDGLLPGLAADPATADVAGRIRTISETTRDAARQTLRASVSNDEAYRAGGADVVAALAPLVGIRTELAVLAGENATPAGDSAQPAPASAPSGSTP